MSQYGVIQAIYMSFYSKKLYRDVALNWGGKSFFYLLFLLALSWIAFTIQLQYGLEAGYNIFSEKLAGQIPVMTIKNGILSTPEKRPYIIMDPDTKKRLAIIDTSGHFTSIDQAQTFLLVTENEIISKPKPNEIKENKLPPSLNIGINPETINTFLLKFIKFSWVLIFPLLVIGSFVYRILQVLLYSVIGKLFSSIYRAQLTYGQIMQIMMVALTPPIICATIFEVFNIVFIQQLLFYFLLAMAYLLYGVIANIYSQKVHQQ